MDCILHIIYFEIQCDIIIILRILLILYHQCIYIKFILVGLGIGIGPRYISNNQVLFSKFIPNKKKFLENVFFCLKMYYLSFFNYIFCYGMILSLCVLKAIYFWNFILNMRSISIKPNKFQHDVRWFENGFQWNPKANPKNSPTWISISAYSQENSLTNPN